MNDDQALLDAFERCTLPPESFKHREHLRVAWCYLKRLPFEEAARRFEVSLVRYAAVHGATAKIDLPLTWAYMGLVAEAVRSGDTTFDRALERRPDLLARRLTRSDR